MRRSATSPLDVSGSAPGLVQRDSVVQFHPVGCFGARSDGCGTCYCGTEERYRLHEISTVHGSPFPLFDQREKSTTILPKAPRLRCSRADRRSDRP
jgi:hypothetical protein